MPATLGGNKSNFKTGSMQVLWCELGSTTGVITAITAADPPVVSDTAHGLVTGDRVRITGVVGMVEVNNQDFLVTKVDDDSFSLTGIVGAGYTAYTSGGTWTKYDITKGGYTEPGGSVQLPQATYADDTVDQLGATVIDGVFAGETPGEVSQTFKELTPALLAKWKKPSTLTGTSRVEGGGSLAGSYDHGDHAALLVLHPIKDADNVNANEWVFYRAAPADIGAIPVEHSSRQMVPVQFRLYPDLDRPAGRQTWRYGA